MADTRSAIECIEALRHVVAENDVLVARLQAAEAERDKRLKRDSGLALIEDAKRWERAYDKARDELAEAKARLGEAHTALREAEWNGSAWIGLNTCPVCGAEQGEGHASDCSLGAVTERATAKDTTRQ